ncbi:MAG: phosphotransferase family protein [Pseudomonadota bacterium]|nr:phosphotransferase family protein [Pseudomonadota bacterium]
MDNKSEHLTNYLAEETCARSVTLKELKKLSYGAIQENWYLFVEFSGGALEGSHKFCLRMDAPTSIVDSHKRHEEFFLIKLAFENGVRVPEPIFFCKDTSILGKEFFISRWVEGSADARKITQKNLSASDRYQLISQIAEQLGKIHNIRPRGRNLKFLTDYSCSSAEQVIKIYRAALDILPQPSAAIEWGLRWAELNIPAKTEKLFCHRDFRTGNLLVDENQLTAVLDWEFANWSDPMEDVGWFCAKCWRFGSNSREAGGIGDRLDFYSLYEENSGRRVDREAVFFWEVLAHIRWAIIARRQGERFATDGENSLEPAMTAYISPQLEWEILKMTSKTHNVH